MTDPLVATHPVLVGFLMGLMFSALVARIWIDLIYPWILERRRKAWENWHANLKWPPPPGWKWREDQRRLVRR